MARRIALTLIVLSTLAITAAYASAFLPDGPPAWAAWALAFGSTLIMVAMMALGATRGGTFGRLGWAFGLVLIIVGGGFALLLALPPADPADLDLWLGLPPRAAVLLYGIGLLPAFVVPIAYALTFDAMTLSEADLARVRAARASADAEAEAAR